jgi:glucose-6-phosphate isomerase
MLSLDCSRVSPHLDSRAIDAASPLALEALRSLVRREGPGAGMLGWLDLPGTDARDAARMADWGKRVQDENDCLVVIGIGGSYLGARAAIEALPGEARFPVLFAGMNLSPEYHARLIETLAGKRFALCVISKSGATLEPAIALRLARNALAESAGARDASKRITAVTDRDTGILGATAAREGWQTFGIPRNVGGRFSVLSPVGLLPCAAAGIPVADVLEGARTELGRSTRIDASNDAVRYALARHLLHERGAAIEILSTFHPELASFAEWWKQLAGESEGKDGRGLFPASAVMTTDLHSLGQYLQEGSRRLLETFLVAAAPRADIVLDRAGADDDGLDYLAGRSLAEVNRCAFEGTREAHADGGLPVVTIEMPSITPDSLGGLFVFFEVAVAVSARLLGVNPFDQPGVEEYKSRMCRLLGKPQSP